MRTGTLESTKISTKNLKEHIHFWTNELFDLHDVALVDFPFSVVCTLILLRLLYCIVLRLILMKTIIKCLCPGHQKIFPGKGLKC